MESYGRIFKGEKGRLPLITSSYSSLINNNDSNFSWPPRSYNCTFCKRIFKSAQALGGHMNVHRRDRAKLRQYSPPPPPTHNPNPNSYSNLNPNPTTLISSSSNTATSKTNVPNLNLLPPPCTITDCETKVSTSAFYSPVINNSIASSNAKAVSCCSKFDELKMDVLYGVKKLKRFDVQEESAMITRRGSVDKDLDLELRLGYI